jgi:c-di-GMP-binding flagellar brake protein YcgR
MVVNISRSGICIRVNEFIPIQSHLYVYLSLPSLPTIEIRVAPAWVAELPHSGSYEVGARFVEMRPEDEEAIQNYQYQTLLQKIPPRKNYPQDL